MFLSKLNIIKIWLVIQPPILVYGKFMLAIFLDIETTGLDPLKHSPIDIALKVIDTSTGEIKGSYQSVIKQEEDQWNKRDPESIKINGYSWEKLLQGKDLSLVSYEVLNLFKSLGIKRGEAVFICQNPAFDRVFLIISSRFIPKKN
jgi:oligoribonuclease